MEKKSKAYEDRLKVYQAVEKIYKTNNRFGSIPQMVVDVKNLKMSKTLSRVYLLLVLNAKSLKAQEKSDKLYDSVAYLYFYTFKNIRDGCEYNRDFLSSIRSNISTIERCVRIIKSDHPFMFNAKLVKEAAKRQLKTTESQGNEVVLEDF